jgi:hypothetical protein
VTALAGKYLDVTGERSTGAAEEMPCKYEALDRLDVFLIARRFARKRIEVEETCLEQQN